MPRSNRRWLSMRVSQPAPDTNCVSTLRGTLVIDKSTALVRGNRCPAAALAVCRSETRNPLEGRCACIVEDLLREATRQLFARRGEGGLASLDPRLDGPPRQCVWHVCLCAASTKCRPWISDRRQYRFGAHLIASFTLFLLISCAARLGSAVSTS